MDVGGIEQRDMLQEALSEPLIMNDDDAGAEDADLEVLEQSSGRTRSERRRTTRHVLQAIFLLLGVGVLVPWNAFISAKGYFQSRLCNLNVETDTYSTSISNIESVFAMLYNLASVTSLGLVIALQALRDQLVAQEHSAVPSPSSEITENPEITADEEGRNSDAHNMSHSFWLVMTPLSLYLTSFLGQTVMVFVVRTSIFEQFTITSLIICGMSCVIAQSGIVATAGLFDADLAMNPYLVGQSVGGVAVSLANFVTACWEDPDDFRNTFCDEGERDADMLWYHSRDLSDEEPEQSSTCSPYEKIDWAAFSYFFLGSLLLVACLLGYSYVDRFQKSEHRDEYETVHNIDNSITGSPRIGIEMHGTKREEATEGLMRTAQPSYDDHEHVVDEEPDGLLNGNPVSDEPANETAAVWVHVRKPAISIFLTFFVTLGLFPGWTSELRSIHQCRTHFRLANDLYVPFMFLFFNVGDLVGRLLSARLPIMQMQDLSTKLVAVACLRFVFFPLLFLCTGGSNPDRLQIHSDLYSQGIQFAFAVSNGFVLSTAFVHAPSLVANTSDMQERMSEILNFSVAFGLLCGSLLSFPVSNFVNR